MDGRFCEVECLVAAAAAVVDGDDVDGGGDVGSRPNGDGDAESPSLVNSYMTPHNSHSSLN